MSAERVGDREPRDPLCFWGDNPSLPCDWSHLAMPLCDDDGVVRKGGMHDGTDYPCTGHAHFGGYHILCSSPAHQAEVGPTDEYRAAAILPGYEVAQVTAERDAALIENERLRTAVRLYLRAVHTEHASVVGGALRDLEAALTASQEPGQ